MKKIVVFYHKDCPDGFGAAWVAWRKFGNRADYIGEEHHLPAKMVKDKEVYFVDFCHSLPIMKKIIKDNRKVVVIDHHKTTKEKLKFMPNKFFSENHSGSVLAWQYFYPGRTVPKILRYVEDCDLWKFKLPKSEAVNSLIEFNNYDFKFWDKLAKDFDNKRRFNEYAIKGGNILDFKNKIVGYLAQRADPVIFEGIKTLAVNSPIFNSEIGNALSKIKPPMGIVWFNRDGKISVSLRSGGRVDVSRIAEKYGGGGQKAASGFDFDEKKPFPWKRLKK